MREIKFRAWDKVVKRMLFDVYLCRDSIEFGENGYHANKDQFIFMQYTGLKDSKGNEIAEGDRLKMSVSTPYHRFEFEVFWREYKWVAKQIGQDFYLDMNNLPCEVTGNIYENHELLDKP